MAKSSRTRKIEALRRWRQRLIQAAILISIAVAVALAWSLLAGPLGLDGGGTLTLEATTRPGQAPAPAKGVPAAPTASGRAADSSQASGAGAEANGEASGSSPGSKPGLLPRVSSEDDIPVYIVGAISRPGVYIVRRGSYLYELVERAGGLAPEAAASSINLALKLSENQMVRIPTEAQLTDPLSPYSYPTASAAPQPGTVNLNTATQVELETLPGIGPAMAAAIIADRQKNGPFTEREDLMRVSGIKESRYTQLEPLICVN